jgi:secretion/DNA translocation related TadE-like protein
VVSDRGSATVITLALTLFLASALLAMISAGALIQRASQLQSAADLAALAASDVSRGVVAGQPCSLARAILREAGFSLVSCELEEGRARVVAGASMGGVPLTARAHAGVIDGGQK